MRAAISPRAAIRGGEDMAAKLRAPRRVHIVGKPDSISSSGRRPERAGAGTFTLVMRRHGFALLSVPAAAAAALEAVLRPEALTLPAWFAAPVLALVVLSLLARHVAPFAAP